MANYLPWAYALLSGRGRIPSRLGIALFRLAQIRAERAHSRARRELLEMDDHLGDILAFAGRGD